MVITDFLKVYDALARAWTGEKRAAVGELCIFKVIHLFLISAFCSFEEIFFIWSQKMSREQQAVARARKAFETGRSKSVEYRINQLKNLQRLFSERQKEIAAAIKKDLNKVSSEYKTHRLLSVFLQTGFRCFPFYFLSKHKSSRKAHPLPRPRHIS